MISYSFEFASQAHCHIPWASVYLSQGHIFRRMVKTPPTRRRPQSRFLQRPRIPPRRVNRVRVSTIKWDFEIFTTGSKMRNILYPPEFGSLVL